jgi:hypothetical protein
MMRRTLYIAGLWLFALAIVGGCDRGLPSEGTGRDARAVKPYNCSTDDTISGKQAAKMIADWDSVTQGLPINNRVSILATYLQPLIEDTTDYPTLRFYLGLVPTNVTDSFNIGLIAMQVDTNCNDRADKSNLHLFTGTSGDSTQISDSLAQQYIGSLVNTIYGLPQFEDWPKVKGLSFSVDYIASFLRDGTQDEKIEAHFAVRDYRCDEVESHCNDGKKRVNGIDVILLQYQVVQLRNLDVQKVAINFSVPCPRFCGVEQEVKSLQ